MRCLELFCGIGGFAAAVQEHASVVGALDLSGHAIEVYRHNFPDHGARQAHLEHLDEAELLGFKADLWWMSPPCQPYTTRGEQRDLQDHRARSLVRLMELIGRQGPSCVAMENVPGFQGSEAHHLVLTTLRDAGYEVAERLLCPSELGIPAQRERYYLVASRRGLLPWRELPKPVMRPLADFLGSPTDGELLDVVVPVDVIAKHGPGMRIFDLREEPTRIANTFTGAYGKTWQAAGAYLRMDDGRVRRFTPGEMLGLMGFGTTFGFPEHVSLRQRYKLIGNSLSVWAMREVLSALIPTLAHADSHLGDRAMEALTAQ
ncbi:DNA methyltransferase [Bradymonadaceae bacterium TMQ3]|uniref:DNA (cytosine-5-)-methyltransferase n=1 Tax=Lujinxingia sediminis TaxID=2480984 RepID=A0ABY0CNC7_9DELT|nr:DNA methyltransferase [Bradymonadaceae bacterium TMQ3]RVU41448.1 DNA methyltransferase [Lujinxingia sediminis]TXC74689.1 DNA methyltransferase [Bradymonadales bacterium TMQ1]